jgi:cytochrome c-type biogenesis protein CcmF
MFLGFVGSAWKIEVETSLRPGETFSVGDYSLTYVGPRMCPGSPKCSPAEQGDITKRMIFADLDVSRNGKPIGRVNPAKFIYHAQPGQPTSEVSMLRSLREDLYTVLGTADPATKRATFQFHINPFVSWIWIGLLILITGAGISLSPELALRDVGAWSYARTAAGVTASAAFALWMAMGTSTAYAATAAPRARAPTVEAAGPPRPGGPSSWSFALAGALGLAAGGVTALRWGRRDEAKR